MWASPLANRTGWAGDVGNKVTVGAVVVLLRDEDDEPLGLKAIETATTPATRAANASHLRMAVDTKGLR